MTRQELDTHLRENVLPCLANVWYAFPDGPNWTAWDTWLDWMIRLFKGEDRVAKLTDTQIETRLHPFLVGWKDGQDACCVDHERYPP